MTQLATRSNGAALVSPGGFIPAYDLAGIQSAANVLFTSGFFTDVRNAAQAMVKVMAGAELGIPPFAAMQGIHIIKGKPCLSAGIMAGKVKGSGKYDFRVVENSDKAVEIAFYQGGDEIGRSRFTIEDAWRAETQNLTKFPRNMLYARAMSNGVKWFTPDIFLGPVYVPEEMGATVDGEGNVIDVNPQTGDVYDRTPVQPRRPKDPDPEAMKHERLDGEKIHAPVIDPATGRPAAPVYRNEEEGEAHYASRISEEDHANAAAFKKGIGTHKGWMVARKMEPENKALSLWLLNNAQYALSQGAHTFWESRKDLTGDQWTACNNYLSKLNTQDLNKLVQEFHATIKREEAGAEEDPLAGETPEEIEARAMREAEAQTATLDGMDVETAAAVPGAFAR